MEKKVNRVKLEIQIDDSVACGQYINMAVVNHNDSEFVLDCIYVQPQVSSAKVRTRLITSPRHAKRMLKALQSNLERYEKKYGVIDLGEDALEQEPDMPVH